MDFILRIKRVFWLSFLIYTGFARAAAGQDTIRARKNLNYLASPQLKGRGYLLKGDQKAARFIRKQFRKFGLKPMNQSYFQPLTFSQNLFPQEPQVRLNTKQLKAGDDFIPVPGCPSIKGSFEIVRPDSMEIRRRIASPDVNSSKQAWLMPSHFRKWLYRQKEFIEGIMPAILLWEYPKLTHSLSEDQDAIAELEILINRVSSQDKEIEVNIEAELKAEIASQNVVGIIEGTQYPDSFLVVCAHYDHLGTLGKKVYFPGASDNASGTAMILEMASHFARKPLKYSLLFIAFTGEEAGLLGSRYFVNHPLIPLSKIRFVMNMDLMGFGEKGATVVNATLHPEEFKRLSAINEANHYLPELKQRGKAANSDHFPFSEAGVPAFFMYTMGGPGYYHDVMDKPNTVTFSRFTETFRLLTNFLEGF